MTKIKFCIVCGSKKIIHLFISTDRMFHLPGKFPVKKCGSCSLVFLDPQPNKKELAKYYPSAMYYSYQLGKKMGFLGWLRKYLIHHYYKQNFLSGFVSFFINKVPAIPSKKNNGKILDVGCGAGDTLVLLKETGWNVYGLDIDKKAVQLANKRGLKNVRFGTYRDIKDYSDHYFDAVRLYHVIEHLDDPQLFFRLVKPKLKKDGEIILGTPHVGSAVSRIFGKYWYNLDTPRHLFLFTPKTLSRLAQKEGFVISKVEFCSAGGIAGSLQYVLQELLNKKIDLIHNIYIVFLFYPFEWFLNKIHIGDVFVIRAKVSLL